MRRCQSSAAAALANAGTAPAGAVLRHPLPPLPSSSSSSSLACSPWGAAAATASTAAGSIASPANTSRRRCTVVRASKDYSREASLAHTIHFQNPAGVGSNEEATGSIDGCRQVFREGSIGAIAVKECLRLQNSYGRPVHHRLTARETAEKLRYVRDPSFSKQQIRRYRQELQRYKKLREELATWSNAFYSRHGVRPTMADVQSTGIEWLITRFRDYVVVREKVLLETMVIRKQLELNPNAELSAAAQEAVEHAPAVHLDPESGRAKLVLNPQPLSPRKSPARRSRKTSTVPAATKSRDSERETSEAATAPDEDDDDDDDGTAAENQST